MTPAVTEAESFEIIWRKMRTLLVIPKGLPKNGKSEPEGG